MKVFIFILLIAELINSQTNIEFISNLNQHRTSGYNDIWGYVDPSGNEYALLGVGNGTSIINLADPSNPIEVAFIPATQTIWRDIKVHDQYAYVVSDGASDGLQIIDLTQLPNSATLANQTLNFFSRAHNIFIEDGYAYAVGTEGGGGMHILDLSNPINPTETAYYTASGYIHDLVVWNDTAIVCAGSSGSYHLVDVTDKSNPQFINASAAIPGIYAHSGWISEDKRYFFATEEFDQTDLMVWDLKDRSSWDLVVPSWQMNSNATIHNLFILGNYAHISYYVDGYVVLDISNPTDPVLAGQYDTYDGLDGPFKGAWGVFPYFPSGYTIISDIETGLYVLKFDAPSSVDDDYLPLSFRLFQNYPNPFNPSTQIDFSIANVEFVNLSVYNSLGEKVTELVNEYKPAGSYSVVFDTPEISSGIYIAELIAGDFRQTVKMVLLK